ncbi:hypothetical protein D3C76_1834320 [compost metagenome]
MIDFILECTVELKPLIIGLRIGIDDRIRLFFNNDYLRINFKTTLVTIQAYRTLVFFGMQCKADIDHQ